ncbi:MAG: DUF1846 domain-containing protein [Fusobacterium sp.]|nr:DUF1846 domain-containing protein [Fusobacterium sp.]
MKIGFDHNKYLEEQSKYILERVNNYDKLYLEFGGKLFADLHAKRVLPGFDENAKIKVLNKLKEKVEVIICVYAGDIERNKIRGDFGITYDMDVFRLIDDLRENELQVNSVVITRYEDRPSTSMFMTRLERRGIKVYKHYATKGYPLDVDTIVSEEGYGQNTFIETTKPIVVVTAPGPGSGKLATCLNQLYHESKNGKNVGYSKFETFPVWNVPLKHPLNIAYESATADLKDVNLIDPFHLEEYNEIAVNYNRDVEAFPLLRRIIEKITGKKSVYQSPTDMGVNRVGFGIIDNEVVKKASEQEIIRRFFKTGCDYKKGNADLETFQRAEFIMQSLGLKEDDRKVVKSSREKLAKLKEEDKKYEKELASVIALELADEKIITGKKSSLMDAVSAAILNAIKYLANLDDELLLISPTILEPIIKLKENTLKNKNVPLDCEEILIALSISAATNPVAKVALEKLDELKGVQAHSTHILGKNDEQTLRKLGIDVTCDQIFPTENLYYNQ